MSLKGDRVADLATLASTKVLSPPGDEEKSLSLSEEAGDKGFETGDKGSETGDKASLSLIGEEENSLTLFGETVVEMSWFLDTDVE